MQIAVCIGRATIDKVKGASAANVFAKNLFIHLLR